MAVHSGEEAVDLAASAATNRTPHFTSELEAPDDFDGVGGFPVQDGRRMTEEARMVVASVLVAPELELLPRAA